MASIKQLTDRKFKITISNGYRANGKKICKAKTITVPDSVKPRGISQYVAHEAEELERLVKSGFAEDRDTTFEAYATRWLERQVKYAPSTLASYRRMLERVYPYIGAIKLGELRPMALENMLIELRKRTHQGRPIQEATVQKYLTVVSAVLSDAKRNEIISKNPARMIDLPDTERREQFIPTDEQAQYFLNALSEEHILYHAFYVLAIYTGCRRGELCALQWRDFSFVDHYTWNLVVSRSRSVVPGKGVVEGPTKNGRSRSMTISYYVVSTLWSLYDFQKRMARENRRKVSPYLFANVQGEPVHPDTFTKRLRKIFRDLGFPSSFHLHSVHGLRPRGPPQAPAKDRPPAGRVNTKGQGKVAGRGGRPLRTAVQKPAVACGQVHHSGGVHRLLAGPHRPWEAGEIHSGPGQAGHRPVPAGPGQLQTHRTKA